MGFLSEYLSKEAWKREITKQLNEETITISEAKKCFKELSLNEEDIKQIEEGLWDKAKFMFTKDPNLASKISADEKLKAAKKAGKFGARAGSYALKIQPKIDAIQKQIDFLTQKDPKVYAGKIAQLEAQKNKLQGKVDVQTGIAGEEQKMVSGEAQKKAFSYQSKAAIGQIRNEFKRLSGIKDPSALLGEIKKIIASPQFKYLNRVVQSQGAV